MIQSKSSQFPVLVKEAGIDHAGLTGPTWYQKAHVRAEYYTKDARGFSGHVCVPSEKFTDGMFPPILKHSNPIYAGQAYVLYGVYEIIPGQSPVTLWEKN